jgi:hypothetical protein
MNTIELIEKISDGKVIDDRGLYSSYIVNWIKDNKEDEVLMHRVSSSSFNREGILVHLARENDWSLAIEMVEKWGACVNDDIYREDGILSRCIGKNDESFDLVRLMINEGCTPEDDFFPERGDYIEDEMQEVVRKNNPRTATLLRAVIEGTTDMLNLDVAPTLGATVTAKDVVQDKPGATA